VVRARLQSAQLKSDMQAFKAANPRCDLEDFVRWHSPRDWLPAEVTLALPLSLPLPLARTRTRSRAPNPSANPNPNPDPEEATLPARLSGRMCEPGNLWAQLWVATLPVAAAY
jgi:hypothetical protein